MNKDDFEHVRRRLEYDPELQQRVEFEVQAYTPILWSGWEGDCAAVLYCILPDGVPQLYVLDGVHVLPDRLLEVLDERVDVYGKAISDTKAFIAKDKGLPPPREWRWLCTACKTEGRGDEPAACPTCGATDAWYNYRTRADDTQTATERLRNLLRPRRD